MTQGPRPADGRVDMETVLIVDDERFFRTVLGDFVTGLGLRALTAGDGEAALALLERERVDLVLLDVVMPEMDGLEVLQRIRKRRPGLPVIIVTASDAMDNAIAALREGADDFFRKPLNLDELTLRLRGILGKAGVAGDVAGGRRRAPRIRMQEGSQAHLQLREVWLLDISQTGALIEHTEPVHLGETYRLSLPVEGPPLDVLARAVRAVASQRVTRADGTRRVVHRTGMEFVGVEQETSEAIVRYVDRLLRETGETDPPPAD